MSVSRVSRLLAPLLLAVALLSVPAAATPAAADPVPARQTVNVLAAGDSITQGRDGDWTWRYLLWKNYQAGTGPMLKFVGSRTDLMYGGTHYREMQPGFSRRHFALASRTLKQGNEALPAELNYEQAAGTVPQVAVIEYGTNDIGQWGQSVKTTISDLTKYMATLRAKVPDVKMVLVDVMHVPHAADYNAALRAIAANDPDHVSVADAATGWSVTNDTWDHDHHPDPSGDAKLANAIAAALVELGVDSHNSAVPTDLPWNPSAGMKVAWSTATRTAKVTWDPQIVDATSVDVQWKKSGGSWTTVSRKLKTSWTSPRLTVGATYDFQLVLHRTYMRSSPGASDNYKTIVANNVEVSKTVTFDSAGRGRTAVSCATACTGYLQIRNDIAGTQKSSVGKFSVKAGSWKLVDFTGIPKPEDGKGLTRIAQGTKVAFRPTTLAQTPTANVNVSRTVTYDAAGKGSINVSCRKACEGYVRLQVNEDDHANTDTQMSSVGHYKIAAGAFTTLHLTAIPNVDNVWARIYQSFPVVGTNPALIKVDLDQAALPAPPIANVTLSSAIDVDSQGKAQIAIRCTVTCSGYLQIWSNDVKSAARMSDTIHYKVKGGHRDYFPITHVPTENVDDAVSRIFQSSPVIAPNPQFRALAIRPHPNVTVTRNVWTDAGNSSIHHINVACIKACVGWLQIWSDQSGTAKTQAIKYSVPAGSYRMLTIPDLPGLAQTARVRLAIASPTEWPTVQFRPVGPVG